MSYRILITLLLLVSTRTTNAQDEFPTRMIGFLKTGQHVGVSTSKDEGTLLTVFNDKNDMEIHRDAEKMDVEELRRKYKKVDQQAEKLLQSHSESSTAKTPSEPSPSLGIGRFAPKGYASVLHVGDDYVLLRYDSGRRTAYSSNQIGRLIWDEGKPNLYVSGGTSKN